MDLSYGTFKSIIRDLKNISSAFYTASLPIPLGMSTFGLILYGGTLPVGETTITCQNTITKLFNEASNKNSWSKVGTVLHTRKCLANSKVSHDGTDEQDQNFDVYQDIQSQIDYSTTKLNVMGYKGDLLRAYRIDRGLSTTGV
jgi:hypothetical protein